MVRQSNSTKPERDLVAEISQRLQEALEAAPVLEIVRIDQQIPLASGQRPDLVVDIRTPSGPQRLLVEIKSDGIPRTLRRAAEALKGRLRNLEGAYGLLAAPYISDRGRGVCRENGIGCLDLAGNIFLSFDRVFIERTGKQNPTPARRLQRSLFAPRSSRALRVLLSDPTRRWYVRDLAAEAGVSLALASRVKQLLRDQDLLGEDLRSFWLSKPEDLLVDWSKAYSYEKNEVSSFYTMLPIPELEERLAKECERRSIRYGLALFSGANRVAPFVRYNRAFAFVEGRLGELVEAIDLKQVPTGANVVLLRPYDGGVFYGVREVGGAKVVSDFQLYLDLKSYRMGGAEAAEFLFARWIKPRWNQGPSQTTRPEL